MRVVVSGVNPTDWRSRSGQSASLQFEEQVPHQDGAGIVDAVGEGVEDFAPGQRVWLWEVAWESPRGTAQEFVTVPARHVVPLPEGASLDVGASLGIPALTAYRTLTTSAQGPHRLGPGTLSGRTVLVQGGAGAVGHAAIQLAAWSGATVLATVSTAEKAELARRAGAHHVIDYRTTDVAARVSQLAPAGVDHIVEIDLGANLATDIAVLAHGGNINVYSYGNGDLLPIPSREILVKNAQLDFTFTYTTSPEHKEQALAGVLAAAADGALEVGAEHGLPLHRYDLDQVSDAHAAVERGVVGKVLIDVAPA